MKELSAYFRYLEGLAVPIVCIFIATQLGALSFLSLPFIYRGVYDQLIPTYDKPLLATIVFSIIFVQLLFALFNFISTILLSYLRGRLIAAIRNRISYRLLFYPYRFFTGKDPGALIQRLIPEVDTVASTVSSSIQGAAYIVQFLVLLSAALFFDATFFFICLGACIFYIFWQGLLKRPIAHFTEKVQMHQQSQFETLGEQIRTIKLIKLFNRYERSITLLSRVLGAIKINHLCNTTVRSLLQISSKTLDLAILAILLYSMYRISAGEMAIGSYIVFSSFIWCFVFPVNFLVDMGNNMQSGGIAARRIGELFIENKESSGEIAFSGVKKSIVFRDVEFGYTNSAKILTGMSFEIPAGSSVAFIGLSGSGKSTIVHLLIRLYTVSKGTILIDGNPIQSYDLFSLRDNIGLMSQDTFLFNDSIAGNVDPHERHTPSDVRKFLDNTDLTEFGSRLDYIVGENGWNLSAGERQRLSMARLFAKIPSVLILDEATANLDPRTEQMVLDNVQLVRRNNPEMTIIMITHGKNYLSRMDSVYFVENGAVSDVGRHDDLMLRNSRYEQALNVLNIPVKS